MGRGDGLEDAGAPKQNYHGLERLRIIGTLSQLRKYQKIEKENFVNHKFCR